MIYRLHRDGQNVGSFSLDELRRRRQSGELNGTEFTWCEGMADWERLDTVLERSPGAAGMPVPPPLPRVARRDGLHPAALVAILASVCLFVAGLIFVGYKAANTVRRALPIVSVNNGGLRVNTGQSSLAIASKPVVWNANTLTEAQVLKLEEAFSRRQWVEGYEQHGDRSEACDADALQYLNASVAMHYGSETNTGRDNFAKWTANLAKDPTCTDPLVLSVVGMNTSDHNAKFTLLDRALAGFPKSKHLAFPQLATTMTLASELSNESPRVPLLDADALTLLKRALADGSLQPSDEGQCAEMLVNGWAQDFFKRNQRAIVDLVRASGKTHEWLLFMLDGEYQITEAWKSRGSGVASTVTDQGWEGFRSHLSQARISLTRAWGLHPERPIAATRMMTVALGDEDLGEMRVWFDRAVLAQIDYPQAWSEMRWGLRPRWYGDPESMLALGATAINTRRFDTDVPRKFIDVVGDLEEDTGIPAGTHLYGRDDIWPECLKMYDGYIANAPAGKSRDSWRTSFSMVAYFAGHYDTARGLFEAMNWQPQTYYMTDWNVEPSLIPGEVAARTGSMSARVAQAEIARDQHANARAAKMYDDIFSAAGTDSRTREFARSRSASLTSEQKLDLGDWVDFLPQSDGDANWVYSWGQAKRTADGALEAHTGAAGHLFYSRVRVGKNFEVKGTFEVPDGSTSPFQAGLVMGLPDCSSNLTSYHWYGFRIEGTGSNRGLAVFSRGWADNQQVTLPVEIAQGPNTFDFILRGDACTATVNGRPLFRNSHAPRNIDTPADGFLLGLGGYQEGGNSVIRYRDIQVKKLR